MDRHFNEKILNAPTSIITNFFGLSSNYRKMHFRKIEELVILKVQEFGIDFTQDIVASTHDGASVI